VHLDSPTIAPPLSSVNVDQAKRHPSTMHARFSETTPNLDAHQFLKAFLAENKVKEDKRVNGFQRISSRNGSGFMRSRSSVAHPSYKLASVSQDAVKQVTSSSELSSPRTPIGGGSRTNISQSGGRRFNSSPKRFVIDTGEFDKGNLENALRHGRRHSQGSDEMIQVQRNMKVLWSS
jgi:hypothetical protein